MGKLEVVYRIRLAYPVLPMGVIQLPAVAQFAETGNTVRIEAPQIGPAPGQPAVEGFEQMSVRVERECTDGEGADTSLENIERLKIKRDAATAFWQLFEGIREADFRRHNVVAGYPVVPSEAIQLNPLVKRCELEWIYQGSSLTRINMGGGIPTIAIEEEAWGDAVKRLGGGRPVPVYARFALDAFYFAEHDPLRGVIMACAAWETALRYYLANVASKRDPAYLVASRGGNVPKLYEFAIAARRSRLYGGVMENLRNLPRLRNKLLHEGVTALPQGAAVDSALAVISAIEWLFDGTDPD